MNANDKFMHTGRTTIDPVVFVAHGEFVGGGLSTCTVRTLGGREFTTIVSRLRKPRAGEWPST